MKLFLSCPDANDSQIHGHDIIKKSATEAGWEVLDPQEIQVPPGSEYTQKRMKMLDSANLLFVWLDQLQPPGVGLFLLQGAQPTESIEIPIPDQIRVPLMAGMQALGMAQTAPKKGIITPGDPMKGMEVTNCPQNIQLAPGGVIAARAQGPFNLPDNNVSFEIGYARAKNIPTVALATARPRCGILPATSVSLVITAAPDSLTPYLKELHSSLEDSLSAFAETAKRLHEKFDKQAKEETEKLKEEIRKHVEKKKAQSQETDAKIVTPNFSKK